MFSIQYFLGCLVMWPTLFFCSRFFFLRFEFYKKLTSNQKGDWDSRIVSDIHVFAVLYMIYWFYFYIPNFLEQRLIGEEIPEYDYLFGLSCSYFFYDMFIITIYSEPLFSWGIVAHHILGTGGFYLASDYHQCPYWGILLLLSEATSPFINNHFFLTYMGLKSHWLYSFNGFVVWFVWFVVRVAPLPGVWMLWYDDVTLSPQPLSGIPWMALSAAIPLLSTLNLFWFFKISRGCFRTLQKLSDKKKN